MKFTGVFGSIIFAFSVTLNVAIAATTDLSVGSTVRSYPLSGVVEAEAGYGLLLWGSEGSPWYGYLRPKIEASSAFTYNSIAEVIEFFPISILGLRAGGESIQNDTNYSAYDCSEWNCVGRFYRGFLEAELTLGYDKFFSRIKWRRENWSQGASGKDFIEPTSGLAMADTGDTQTVWQYLLGYRWADSVNLIAGIRQAHNNAKESSSMPFGLYDYKWSEGLRVGAGAGLFKSEIKSSQLTLLAFIKWEVWPSIAIK